MEILEIPYQQNSADLFEHFVHLPHAVFLDSCLPQQQQGRYDIMSALPEKTITTCTKADDPAPFEAIKLALKTLQEKTAPHTKHKLPFTIGAIGYLGYDIGRKIESIPNIASDDIHLPASITGIYHWSIVVDHKIKTTYFITAHPPGHPKRIQIESLLNTSAQSHIPFQITKDFTANISQSLYAAQFSKIKQHIYNGNCYQINFARRFNAEFSGSTWHAYNVLRKRHPAPFAAYFTLPHGSLASLSPERFLKLAAGHVETKPIKGTMPRDSDPTKDKALSDQLLSSEKDRAENVMIVDLLRNDLSRVCKPGSVKVPKLCALESFSNVHHLVSTVTGTLSSQHTAIDLLAKCFPGGSITGAPKVSAMKIIETLEPHRRSVYCGSIFYADVSGSMDSNITIRTLISSKNEIYCYAGGGIVYDSNCQSEYNETWDKVGKIIDILNDIGK